MDRLWAPWRAEYIKKAISGEEKGCFLCDAWQSEEPEKFWIVHKSSLSFVILNIYPYNAGHVMVAPSKHTGDIEELSEEESLNLIKEIQTAVIATKKAYQPKGINIGMNLGRAAGAGLEEHLHFHIVPRWFADTNFMPVTAATKVLSELLDETFAKLKTAFEHIISGDK